MKNVLNQSLLVEENFSELPKAYSYLEKRLVEQNNMIRVIHEKYFEVYGASLDRVPSERWDVACNFNFMRALVDMPAMTDDTVVRLAQYCECLANVLRPSIVLFEGIEKPLACFSLLFEWSQQYARILPLNLARLTANHFMEETFVLEGRDLGVLWLNSKSNKIRVGCFSKTLN